MSELSLMDLEMSDSCNSEEKDKATPLCPQASCPGTTATMVILLDGLKASLDPAHMFTCSVNFTGGHASVLPTSTVELPAAQHVDVPSLTASLSS